MSQLEHIEAIEKRLWTAADTLRANSNYASNEYFLPVMGLVFLRHAYSRFLTVRERIEANLPTRGGKPRPLTKEDFSRQSAIFLQERAQFDYLVSLPDSEDRAKAIIEAMESIEADYENLRGVLPKSEYQELENQVLGQLLRTLNPDELKKVTGDVFGRIYEYFLTQFADQKAHDGGEFFTPVSLVSLIAHVLEPERGTVLDPACGSGGMFVQSARIVEQQGQSPTERLTFRGLEKNATTIRLAKMNLAVHGLEGDIQRAITYYEDPHELVGKADYVMANPPFNVDEIDADKIKSDPRLPFGLPGVSKGSKENPGRKGKVSNGNYIWISYFYSYLNDTGKAGFVMSSQASSAGDEEAKVRQQLVETGDVDVMIAIRSNFFYTRTVPCELWFLDRDKPAELKHKVLMIDARSIYRKVTRKIYDFSPEQQQNLLAIVWLYRGQAEKFLELVSSYCSRTITEGAACFSSKDEINEAIHPLPDFTAALGMLMHAIQPFLHSLPKGVAQTDEFEDLNSAMVQFRSNVEVFRTAVSDCEAAQRARIESSEDLNKAVNQLSSLVTPSNKLIKQADLLYKLVSRLIEVCESELNASESSLWPRREISLARKAVDLKRISAVEQLKSVRYYWRQAHWLIEQFPEARLRDVEGLVRLVDRNTLAANDWSLSPGRYVGVAHVEQDDDFDLAEALHEIHTELEDLNTEAVELALTIRKNFEELEV